MSKRFALLPRSFTLRPRVSGIGQAPRLRPQAWDAARRIFVPHVVFALCLIVPFVVLCALIGRGWVASEQSRSDTRITELAERIGEDLTHFIEDRIMVLEVLAASTALDTDDVTRLEEQARGLLKTKGSGLLLRERTGRVLLNTLARSWEGPGTADLARPYRGDGPQVTDLIGTGGARAVLVDVPVMRQGVIRWILSIVLLPSDFSALIRQNAIGGDLMGVIVDRRGRVVGRSLTSQAAIGQTITGPVPAPGEHGFWLGNGVAGTPLRIAYRTLDDVGFGVRIGMTQAEFEAPLQRTLWSIGALAAALLLGAFALSAPLLWRMLAAYGKLGETATLLGLAQEAAEAGMWDWEISGRRLYLAARNARQHGLTVPPGADGITVTIEEWEARVFPEDLPAVWEKAGEAIATQTVFDAEFRTYDPSAPGGFRWVQTLGRVLCDEGGRPWRLVGLHLNVTDRREIERKFRESAALLEASEERLALALDSGEDGLFDWDIATDEVWVSDRWLAKVGIADGRGPRPSLAWHAEIHPDDRKAFGDAVVRHLDGHCPAMEIEYRRLGADGGEIWVLARGRVMSRSAEGRPLRMVGTMMDITRRKEAEMRVAHMALHDALTNLPNRNLFNQHLQEVLTDGAAGRGYAVLACDLDRFKAVNDTFGHSAGDRLLCLVADSIQAILHGRGLVARLGGDEFAVVLTDVEDGRGAELICERIIAALGEPFHLDGNAINIGISIGVALATGGELTAEQVFRRADTALYEAKAAGRNTYRLYEAEAHARNATRSLLALDMKEAIRRGDFFLVYQPVIDITTGCVASFEALMRWRHPERGLISPGEFIPVAEETGLIIPLGAWALAEACREAMHWPADVRVGVNVSAVQFGSNLEQSVLKALVAAGMCPGRLKLEVTESLLMQNPEQAFAELHRLRACGVRIALDDFGTGYSSLSYLRRFPFDKLKIDRAFVRDIADPDAAAIVRAVVGIGERLGMGVVAEGVETHEQLDIVRREGCTEVQGFLFSRPLSADDARTFLIDRHQRDAA